MALTLDQIRKNHPKFDSLNDDELFSYLSENSYPNIAPSELAKKIGYYTPEQRSRGILSDTANALKQGVERIPGELTGVGDTVAGLGGFDRPFSRTFDAAGEATGLQFGKWATEAEGDYSPAMQEAQANIDAAWNDPNSTKADIAAAYAKNPRATYKNVVSSLPQLAAGGILARELQIAGMGRGLAIGAGEGIVSAGDQMEGIDRSVDPETAAKASLVTGAGTAALGMAGNKIAKMGGFGDIDAIALRGGLQDAAGTGGLPKRIIGSMVTEPLEEGSQSALESVSKNYAEGNPLIEGMARNITEGALAGSVMGGAVATLSKTAEQRDTETNERILNPEASVDDSIAAMSESLTAAPEHSTGINAGQYEQTFQDAANKYGIPVDFLKAVAQQESGMRQFDAHGKPVSPGTSTAIGMMQIIPKWHPEFDPHKLAGDAEYNINAGAKFISDLMREHDGDLSRVAGRYYGSKDAAANQRYADSVLGKMGGEIPVHQPFSAQPRYRDIPDAEAIVQNRTIPGKGILASINDQFQPSGYVPGEAGQVWEQPNTEQADISAEKNRAFFNKEQSDLQQKADELYAMELNPDANRQQVKQYRKARADLEVEKQLRAEEFRANLGFTDIPYQSGQIENKPFAKLGGILSNARQEQQPASTPDDRGATERLNANGEPVGGDANENKQETPGSSDKTDNVSKSKGGSDAIHFNQGAAEGLGQDQPFTPTHELTNDNNLPVVATGEPHTYVDAQGTEIYEPEHAKPITSRAISAVDGGVIAGVSNNPVNAKQSNTDNLRASEPALNETPQAPDAEQSQASTDSILTDKKGPYLLKKQREYIKANPNVPVATKNAAIKSFKDSYEVDVDKASAALPFEQYKALPINQGQSDGLLTQAHNALREEYGITNDQENKASFTIERVEGNNRHMLTFAKGDDVKIAGSYPMKQGKIIGISKAKKQVNVGGLWHDYGYVYKPDYDEYTSHRNEIDSKIAALKERLDVGNSIEAEQQLDEIKKQVDRYKLAEYTNKVKGLESQKNKVQRDFEQRLKSDGEAKHAEESRKLEEESKRRSKAEPDSPIKMTMKEWAAIHSDFKGKLPDGSRSVMRNGKIQPVEIIKQHEQAPKTSPSQLDERAATGGNDAQAGAGEERSDVQSAGEEKVGSLQDAKRRVDAHDANHDNGDSFHTIIIDTKAEHRKPAINYILSSDRPIHLKGSLEKSLSNAKRIDEIKAKQQTTATIPLEASAPSAATQDQSTDSNQPSAAQPTESAENPKESGDSSSNDQAASKGETDKNGTFTSNMIDLIVKSKSDIHAKYFKEYITYDLTNTNKASISDGESYYQQGKKYKIRPDGKREEYGTDFSGFDRKLKEGIADGSISYNEKAKRLYDEGIAKDEKAALTLKNIETKAKEDKYLAYKEAVADKDAIDAKFAGVKFVAGSSSIAFDGEPRTLQGHTYKGMIVVKQPYPTKGRPWEVFTQSTGLSATPIPGNREKKGGGNGKGFTTQKEARIYAMRFGDAIGEKAFEKGYNDKETSNNINTGLKERKPNIGYSAYDYYRAVQVDNDVYVNVFDALDLKKPEPITKPTAALKGAVADKSESNPNGGTNEQQAEPEAPIEKSRAEGHTIPKTLLEAHKDLIDKPEGDIKFSKSSLQDVEIINELSKNDEIFRHPVSEKKDLRGIMAEVVPGAEFMHEGEHKGVKFETYSTDDSKTFWIYEKGSDVWIDVSNLKVGSKGSEIYAAVGNYAFNAGKVFIGDPNGLSEAAVLRRTNAMLSLALRYGSTDFLGSSPEQSAGDVSKGIKPLKWEGSHVDKVTALIDTIASTLYANIPVLRGYRYDFDNQQFEDKLGRPLRPDWAGRLAREPVSREIRAGESTLRRGVFLESLASGTRGEKSELLARLQAVRGVGLDGLNELFSKSAPATGSTVAEIKALLPSRVNKLVDAGILRIAQSTSEVPQTATSIDANGVEGFYDSAKDELWLISDNLDSDNLLPTLNHELFHRLENVDPKLRDAIATFDGQIQRMINLAEKGVGAPIVKAAYKRMTSAGTPEKDILSEMKAYLVTEWSAKPYTFTGQLKKFIQDFIGAIKAAMMRVGIMPKELTPAILAQLAKQGAKVNSVINPSRIEIAKGESDIKYSRTMSDLSDQAREMLSNHMTSAKTFNWWHKTVGTQAHKATVDENFKAVFDKSMAFEEDTAKFANEAADMAPSLLPKLDGIKDVGREVTQGWQRLKDAKAVGKAIFQTTLDDKPLTDDELSDYGYTDKQRTMYHEFFAAVNKSMDDLAKSEMLREAKALKLPAAPDSFTVKDAASWYADHAADANEGKSFIDKAKQVEKLQKQGYAPLMRFGKYTLDVVEINAEGEEQRVFFGMFENESEANQMKKAMREEYPDADITSGIMSQNDWQMFKGVTPETMEIFAKMMNVEQKDAFQMYLAQAVNNRSAMKRLIHRKKMPGFAADPQRVLASFITSNAKAASKNIHLGDMVKAIADIPKSKGDVTDEAVNLYNYVQNPSEKGAAIRGLLFTWYLGGSAASAMVNLTQTLTTTAPYLHQFGDTKQVAAIMAKAMKSATKPISAIGGDLGRALKRAEEEGVTAPHELHMLYGESMRTGMIQSQLLRPLTKVWGSLFSLAESYNRRVAFISAYNLATETGKANPFEFAAKAVNDTQFIYNKTARPNWARSTVGSMAFTFKTFTINYLEFLVQLPPKERLIALGVLIMLAGLSGLPGADDADDIIDSIGQGLGYNTNAKEWKQQVLGDMVGKTAANYILYGISTGTPFDISQRLSVGNVVPGSAMFKRSETDKTRDVLEFVGPVGGLAKKGMDAFDAAQTREGLDNKVSAIGKAIVPKAISDAWQAVDMVQTGQYRDFKGRNVTETSASDALFKALGLQPTSVSEKRRAERLLNQDVQLTKDVKADIAGLWAQGVNEKDAEKIAEAKSLLKDWNDKNPETPIHIKINQIMRRVKQMKLTSRERMLKTTPKELRNYAARITDNE